MSSIWWNFHEASRLQLAVFNHEQFPSDICIWWLQSAARKQSPDWSIHLHPFLPNMGLMTQTLLTHKFTAQKGQEALVPDEGSWEPASSPGSLMLGAHAELCPQLSWRRRKGNEPRSLGTVSFRVVRVRVSLCLGESCLLSMTQPKGYFSRDVLFPNPRWG